MDGDFSRSWSNYVRQQLGAHRGGLTNEEVGDLVGVSASGIGNWLGAKNFKKPSADSVIAFHERFGRGSTLPEAMAAAGYGKVEDYDTVTRTKPDISLVDTADLLEEVYGRTTTGGDLKVLTKSPVTMKRPRFRARPGASPI